MKNIYFSVLRTVILMWALALIILLIFSSTTSKNTYDNNILFVVDLSYSMNAKDVKNVNGVKDVKEDDKISRLEAAKEIISQMLAVWGEANYGLVLFSQVATQYLPLTADTWTFLDYLKNVNTGLLPWGGTDRNSLEKIFSGNATDYSKIIFISDAEQTDLQGRGSRVEGRGTAKKYFIGVGTKEGGNPTLPNGTIMKLKQRDIVSSFDMQTALTISDTLHAKLFPLENIDDSADVIDEILTSSRIFAQTSSLGVQTLIVVLWMFILLAL